MPFTFSHPAIVLPLNLLKRKWFSLTGLVIGSMAPDFEYFLRMKTLGIYGHSLDGIFWFDLPLTILLAFIFHNIVRNYLFDNLPIMLKSRLSDFKKFNWNQYFKKNWLIVIISIIIGTTSHIFWDNFTHYGGYFVEIFPGLADTTNIAGIEIKLYKILQHSSTLIGGLIIAYSIYKLPKTQNVSESINRKYWSIWIIITLAIIGIRFLTGLDYKLYGYVIVTSITAGMLSLIITPIILKKITGANSGFAQ